GVFRVRVPDLHAELGARHLAGRYELPSDRSREVDRNRKAVPDVVAGLRRDRAVDADDLAARVHQRATRVAGVDGGVGLDVVLDPATRVGRGQAEQAPALRA